MAKRNVNYETGYSIVRIRQDVQSRYCGQPWTKVVTAAEVGTDGLELVNEGDKGVCNFRDTPEGYSLLREIRSATFGRIAGLMYQQAGA